MAEVFLIVLPGASVNCAMMRRSKQKSSTPLKVKPIVPVDDEVEEACEATPELAAVVAPSAPGRRLQLINLTVNSDELAIAKRVRVKRSFKRAITLSEPDAEEQSRDGSVSEGRSSCISNSPSESGVVVNPDEQISNGQGEVSEAQPIPGSKKPANSIKHSDEDIAANDEEPLSLVDQLDHELLGIQQLHIPDSSPYSDICGSVSDKVLSICDLTEPSEEVVELLSKSMLNGFDFDKPLTIGNNAKLRIMIDVVHNESEEIVSLYQVYRGNLTGIHFRPPPVLLLVTNKCLYLLNPKHESCAFNLAKKIELHSVDDVYVDSNYQGISIVPSNKKDACQIFCTSESLTRAILANLRSAFKKCRFGDLNILEESSMKRIVIAKALSKFLSVEISDVNISLTFLVYWQSHYVADELVAEQMCSTPKLSLVCDDIQGMLMYKLKKDSDDHWTPGYFVANNGLFACFADSTEKSLKFLAYLSNNYCKCCRRLSCPEEVSRPNVIELGLIIDNIVENIYIAVSNESDVNKWMQALLMNINIISSECQGRLSKNTKLEKFCHAVITEDSIFTLCQESLEPTFSILGCLNISDVVAAYCGNLDTEDSVCYLLFELDTTENVNFASSCEWVFYFLTEEERAKFVAAVSDCWTKLFQVSLPVVTISEEPKENLSIDISVIHGTVKRLVSWHANVASLLSE